MFKIMQETLLVLLGNMILALGVGLFLLPNNILSGGLAGIAVLLNPFIPVDNSYIVAFLSISLLLLGWIFLGNKFFATTCLSSVVYPMFLVLVEKYLEVPVVDPILASLYGGILGGAGIGIVVKQGSSTGGMDIPPLIMNKFFKVDISKSIMVVDGLTVFFGLWIYGLEEVLIGLLSVYTTGLAISKMLMYGSLKTKSVQIISDEYETIIKEVDAILKRGVTLVDYSGSYRRKPSKMLLVVVSEKEYPKLIKIVEEIDSKAFVIVTDASEVHGQGFREFARI